jgi:Cu2+-exporting ATPase
VNSNTKHGYPVAGAAHEMHADHREHSGHNQHAGHSVAMFRDKFWLSLALALPVVFWSDDVQHWLGYHAPTFPGSQLIPAILGTIVFVYGGRVFIQGALRELSDRQPGMMSLISLAIVVAFTASFAATLGFFKVDVWWERRLKLGR